MFVRSCFCTLAHRFELVHLQILVIFPGSVAAPYNSEVRKRPFELSKLAAGRKGYDKYFLGTSPLREQSQMRRAHGREQSEAWNHGSSQVGLSGSEAAVK